jgi:uncharacterized protein YutE (UPF0331/DUF86 family)
MSSQSKTPAQFAEVIAAARFSAQAGIDVAQMLINQEGGDVRSNHIHLRQQQERAAEIERQIEIIERMVDFFAKVSA